MEKDLWEYLKTAQKPIVLYGMGNGADKIIAVLEQKGIKFDAIFASDGFVREKFFHGMPIKHYSDLKNQYGDMIVLLCFGSSRPEVLENVKKIAAEQELYAPEVPVIGDGLFDKSYYLKHRENFKELSNILADNRSKQTLECLLKYKISGKIDYLFQCEVPIDEPYQTILTPRDNEIFLDLGAYNGETALDFARRSPNYKNIIAVEPDRRTFQKLIKNTEHLRDIERYNFCISDFSGIGKFGMKSGRNSAVSSSGTDAMFHTVDSLLDGREVTFIKMDIEGEENRALLKAEQTIHRFKPRLLISAYHRTEDFWALPQTVLSIRPDYRVYMRHFPSLPAWDTVYYFI